MNNIRIRIYKSVGMIALFFLILITCQWCSLASVYGETGGSLLLENLQVGDQVEIYRIASYSERAKNYVWESAVSDWLINKSEGNVYKSLSPEKLEAMTQERAQEFCETLLIGLKNEKEGIANLRGYTFSIHEDQEQYTVNPITPGYYILLPKGVTRIYSLKWVHVEEENPITIAYEENAGDYQLPHVEVGITKKEEVTEEEEQEEGNLEEDDIGADELFARNEDLFEVHGKVSLPNYPNMYPTGKRILTLTLVIPKGLRYEEDSLKVATEELEYSIGDYLGVTIYSNNSDEQLFFATQNGYFYEMNGNPLLSEATPQEALDKYNTAYGTEYQLPKELDIKFADQEELGDGQESEDDLDENQEDNMPYIEPLGNQQTLQKEENMKVFVISLGTENIPNEIELSYEFEKNSLTNDSGFYDNLVMLSYSTSPLNANLISSDIARTRIKSYGIQIYLCKGDGQTNEMTNDELLYFAKRLKGAEFTLYRLTKTIDGTVEQLEEEDSTENPSSMEGQENNVSDIQSIYDEEQDKTFIYSQYRKLIVDDKGIASVGGIEPDDYLLVQTKYPSGHTLSESSMLISQEDWTDESVMEGNELIEFLWMDYETVYLPGTGKRGIMSFVVIGSLLSVFALLILAERYYGLDYLLRLKKIKRFIKK